MILLNSTMKLQAFTTGTPSAALKYYIYFQDFASTFVYDAITPAVGTFNQVATDIAPAPEAGKFRQIKTMSIYNGSNAPQEVNIVVDIASSDTPIISLNVNAGEYLEYNEGEWKTTATTTIGSDLITLAARSSNPSAPGSGLLLYTLPTAGRNLPRFIGPSGLDSFVQPALFGNGVMMVTPNTTTTFNVIGTVQPTNVGTLSHPTLNANSFRESTRRAQLLSAATGGSASETRIAYASVWRGNGAGLGGFYFRARIGLGPIVSTQRLAVGLWAATGATPTTIDPSTIVNGIWFGNDAGDSNYQIMYNNASGTATKIDLGASFVKNVLNAMYDVTFFAAPNSNSIGYSITRNNDGATVSGVITSDIKLPVQTAFLAPHLYLNNGGTASAVTLDIMKLYIETDQ